MDPTRNTTRSPEDPHYHPAPRPMRTYYQAASVRVTDRWLTVGDDRYAIAELHDLRTARGPRDRLVLGAIVVAGSVAVLGAVGMPYLHTMLAWAGVALFATLMACLAATTVRIRNRHYELWAAYRGADVLLLRTSDERAYGAITRALIRAREATPPDGAVGGLRFPASV